MADQYGLVFKLNDTRARYVERCKRVERSGEKAADRLPASANCVVELGGFDMMSLLLSNPCMNRLLLNRKKTVYGRFP